MPSGFLLLSACAPAASGDLREALAPGLAAAGWRREQTSESVSAWTYGSAGRWSASPYGEGWIFGDLWSRSGADGPPQGGGDTGRLPPGRAARALSLFAYGRYVALWPEGSGTGLVVFRDPSGAQDVFCGRRNDVVWAASSLSLPGLASLVWGGGVRWDRLADMLADPTEAAGRPALDGVETVCPGECVRFTPEGEERELVWSPAAQSERPLARSLPSPADLKDLRRGLRSAVAGAVTRGLQLAPSWLAEVSGGFDSAVVAGLAAGDPRDRIAAWPHYVGSDREADERVFARAIARRHGTSLTEIPKGEVSLDAGALAAIGRGGRPCLHGLDPDYDQSLARLQRETGAKALLTGQGGDTVFWTFRTPLVAGPLVAARGWRALGDPGVRALSLWARSSVWRTIADVRRARRGRLRSEACALALAHPDIRTMPKPRRHPWLQGLEAVDPARRPHIEELARCQLLLAESPRGAFLDEVHPLLFQPVIEFSLRTPPLALLDGARDRGLAREAFRDILPDEVRVRRGKGDLTAYYGRMVARSLPLLLPFLLEGRLAAQGLLDRPAVEAALDADRLLIDGGVPDIMDLLAFEAWAQHWSPA